MKHSLNFATWWVKLSVTDFVLLGLNLRPIEAGQVEDDLGKHQMATRLLFKEKLK